MKNLFGAAIVFAALAVATVASATEVEGIYDFKGAAPSGSEYHGTMTIVKNGASYAVTSVHASHTNTGVGLVVGDQFAVAWARPDGSIGVSLYQIKGTTLTGVWITASDKKMGTETLTKR